MLSSLIKYSIRNTILISGLAATTLLTACSSNRSTQAAVTSTELSNKNQSNELQQNIGQQNLTAEQNKKIVTEFYEGVFLKHQVKAFSDQYIGDRYIQHNPHVPDGKAPFVDYFTGYFKENPQAKSVIKRAVAEGDLVFLHVHSKQHEQDRGVAVVDIFKVENGKIIEHWDVQQDVPAPTANTNTMF